MKNAPPLPTTQRLALRRFTPDDLDLLDRLNGDPRVMRYAGGPKTRTQIAEMLKVRILDYYEQHQGLGSWATIERATGECVGLHLLNNIHGESHIQVGYLLFPQHWGRGYATEMCVALLRYGFAEVGLEQIVAITDHGNVESQRVLLKAGLERHGERSFPHPNYAGQGPLAWFERDGGAWLAEHG
jgi:RimJ/RimL family protein N-acetyltransferase